VLPSIKISANPRIDVAEPVNAFPSRYLIGKWSEKKMNLKEALHYGP